MKFSGRVKGKVALVTGAALGVGRACAIKLAQEGAAVAVTDFRDAEAQALVDDICRAGGTVGYWHMNVLSEGEVKDVMAMVKRRFGPVTVLVNNAGVAGINKPTHEIATSDWDHMMAVNARGVFLCTKYALLQMLGAGSGSIINISSIYDLVGTRDIRCNQASEGAVQLMTKTDALLYAPNHIRVNSIRPGFAWAPLAETGAKTLSVLGEESNGFEPIDHREELDDVAHGVVYLASDESKLITGSDLVVGGYLVK